MGENIKKYRNEWKYSLTNGELSLLKSRISEAMDKLEKMNGIKHGEEKPLLLNVVMEMDQDV